MKKKKRFVGIKLLFIVLVVILLSLYFKNNTKNHNYLIPFVEVYEYQNEIKNNTNETLDENLINFIIDFFNIYYRSMKELKSHNMKEFFYSEKDALLNQTSLELLIESRKQALNDLGLKKAKYDLTFTKITSKDNSIYIELLEDSYLDFNFLTYTSKVYNILNTFEIVKDNDQYKIKDYYKEQGHFIMVYKLLDENKDYIEQLTKIKNNYIDLFNKNKQEQEKLFNEYINNKNKTFKKCDHDYDRNAAVEYALKYVRDRDNNVPNYDKDGNCQNYASWAMFKGGIPMDTIGSYTWKNKNGNKTATWTAVGYFYNYAKYNTGYGLCSQVDINPYYAQKGDIAQVGYNNKYRHTAFIIDTFEKNGNVIDLILSSNTGDLEYYPLSAYTYPEKRVIKILGWNEK